MQPTLFLPNSFLVVYFIIFDCGFEFRKQLLDGLKSGEYGGSQLYPLLAYACLEEVQHVSLVTCVFVISSALGSCIAP